MERNKANDWNAPKVWGFGVKAFLLSFPDKIFGLKWSIMVTFWRCMDTESFLRHALWARGEFTTSWEMNIGSMSDRHIMASTNSKEDPFRSYNNTYRNVSNFYAEQRNPCIFRTGWLNESNQVHEWKFSHWQNSVCLLWKQLLRKTHRVHTNRSV